MTATNANDPNLLVAIDISKHRDGVLISIPGKKRRRRLTVCNRLEEFKQLIAKLIDYALPVRAAFEATRNCHHAMAISQASLNVKEAAEAAASHI